MGNNNESKSFLQKGEGLRILSIKLNSPFDGKVQPFFDFIIDVIPLELQRSPKQILEKLTLTTQTTVRSRTKDFNEIVLQNEQRKLQIKLVSTKHRNVRSITITPNRNWNGSKDLIGINVRKQKYDEVFDTYFPVAQIQNESPIYLAGVKNGQYLIGCLQFPYLTMNNFIQGLYDRFFDKEVPDKHVHLAIYDMLQDQVSVKPVLLRRGWGGNGLLGCQFLQGQVYKFPSNFKQRRQAFIQQQKTQLQKQKIKFEIQECDGASKTLAEALRNKRSKKGKYMQILKNTISVALHEAPKCSAPYESKQQQATQSTYRQQISINGIGRINSQNTRIQFLENRISHLEKTLLNVREYLDSICQTQISEQRQIQIKTTLKEQHPQLKTVQIDNS